MLGGKRWWHLKNQHPPQQRQPVRRLEVSEFVSRCRDTFLSRPDRVSWPHPSMRTHAHHSLHPMCTSFITPVHVSGAHAEATARADLVPQGLPATMSLAKAMGARIDSSKKKAKGRDQNKVNAEGFRIVYDAPIPGVVAAVSIINNTLSPLTSWIPHGYIFTIVILSFYIMLMCRSLAVSQCCVATCCPFWSAYAHSTLTTTCRIHPSGSWTKTAGEKLSAGYARTARSRT